MIVGARHLARKARENYGSLPATGWVRARGRAALPATRAFRPASARLAQTRLGWMRSPQGQVARGRQLLYVQPFTSVAFLPNVYGNPVPGPVFSEPPPPRAIRSAAQRILRFAPL